MKEILQHITELTPAWDRRDSDPSKNYGVHGVDLRMIVKGAKGATQFVVLTNWMLPHLRPDLNSEIKASTLLPCPVDVGYHSPTPRHDGQTPMENCPYLDNRNCYYDGSGLQAEKMFELLVEFGSARVWQELENRYHELFDENNSRAEWKEVV